jgi:hypothetical protein
MTTVVILGIRGTATIMVILGILGIAEMIVLGKKLNRGD